MPFSNSDCDSLRYCLRCGNETQDDSNYCPRCGRPLNAGNEEALLRRYFILFAIGVIIICAVIIAFAQFSIVYFTTNYPDVAVSAGFFAGILIVISSFPLGWLRGKVRAKPLIQHISFSRALAIIATGALAGLFLFLAIPMLEVEYGFTISFMAYFYLAFFAFDAYYIGYAQATRNIPRPKISRKIQVFVMVAGVTILTVGAALGFEYSIYVGNFVTQQADQIGLPTFIYGETFTNGTIISVHSYYARGFHGIGYVPVQDLVVNVPLTNVTFSESFTCHYYKDGDTIPVAITAYNDSRPLMQTNYQIPASAVGNTSFTKTTITYQSGSSTLGYSSYGISREYYVPYPLPSTCGGVPSGL